MRRLLDFMILMMVLAITLGVIWQRHETRRQAEELRSVQNDLARFDEKLAFHGAMWQTEQSDNDGATQYPPHVLPQWFEDKTPSNPLVTPDRPWLDIAPADDHHDQPPDPLATGDGQAAFWYNPNLGIVRARVPQQVSDRLSLELYNKVNGTYLTELPRSSDPDRAPLAFNPGPLPPTLHASPDKRAVGKVLTRDPDADTAESPEQAEQIPWWKKRKYEPPKLPDPDEAQVVEVDPDRPSLLSPGLTAAPTD